jgi:hypothetical protein
VGEDEAITYVAIRSDEQYRQGYLSTKPNISARYPFIEDGLNKEDVLEILTSSGLGIPKYYEWRSRSGCYFCFFQRKDEWIGLSKRYPDLFEKAKAYEQFHKDAGRLHTWSQGEYLEDMVARSDEIMEKARLQEERTANKARKRLVDRFDDDDGDGGCLICTL